jgi:hypothetical protein
MFVSIWSAIRSLVLGAACGIALYLPAPADAGIIVDIDALANATTTDGDMDDPSAVAVAVAVSAGTWRIEPIGPAQGGAHTAWNAWGGAAFGCDARGENCAIGWMHWYRVQPEGAARLRLEDGVLYGSAVAALAAGVGAELTLAAAATVYFFVYDSGPQDNVGGISLRLTEVPAPATLVLLAAALAGLVVARRAAGTRAAAGRLQRRRGVGRQSGGASSKPENWKAGPTVQPTSVQAPRLSAVCQ